MLNLLLLAWVRRRRHRKLFLLFRQSIPTGHGVAATIAGAESAMSGFPVRILPLHMLDIAGTPATGDRLAMDGSGLKVAGVEVYAGRRTVSPRQQAIIKE